MPSPDQDIITSDHLGKGLLRVLLVVLSGCGTDSAAHAEADQVRKDMPAGTSAGRGAPDAPDPGAADASLADAAQPGAETGVDAGVQGAHFATYRIEVGTHVAQVFGGALNRPFAGFATLRGRDYNFIFDPSAGDPPPVSRIHRRRVLSFFHSRHRRRANSRRAHFASPRMPRDRRNGAEVGLGTLLRRDFYRSECCPWPYRRTRLVTAHFLSGPRGSAFDAALNFWDW